MRMLNRQGIRFVLSACCLNVVLVAVVQAGPYRDAVMADNPVGYWRLEESVNMIGSAFDTASGNQGSQDGTVNGGVTTVAGAIGSETSNQAMRFDGSSGYVDVQDPNGVLGSSNANWTVEFWMKPEGGGGAHQNPVVKGHFSGAGGTFFNHTSGLGNLGFGINNGSPSPLVDVDLPVDDEWVYVVGMLERDVPNIGETQGTVYLNGEFMGQGSVPAVQSDNAFEPFTIGSLYYGDPQYVNHFLGTLDEVAIYDKLLNADQIDAHYTAAGFTVAPTPTGQEWGTDVSGNWNVEASWNNGIVPDGNDQEATLGGVISSPRTVFTETDVTVKSITFHNASQYVVAGNGSLNLESNSGNAALTVAQGSHQLQLAVNLATDSDADISVGGSLEFANRLNLNGHKLTKLGEGELIVSNTLNTGGGTLDVHAGTLSGGGQIGGNLVVNGAVVSPGNGLPSASAVPEPGTFVLLIIGLVGMLCQGRRGS